MFRLPPGICLDPATEAEGEMCVRSAAAGWLYDFCVGLHDIAFS